MKKFVFLAAFLTVFITFTAAMAKEVKVVFVVNCNESITLRESPSTYANEITQIPLGQGIEFLDYANNGFYKVSYGRHIGYALADYLSFEAPNYMRRGTVTQALSVFDSPSTRSEKIASLISGDWVLYVGDAYFASYPGEGPDFYLVKLYNGIYGYIMASKVQWDRR